MFNILYESICKSDLVDFLVRNSLKPREIDILKHWLQYHIWPKRDLDNFQLKHQLHIFLTELNSLLV